MVYHFVVLSDEVDNFRREIDIDAESTFQDLNDLLVKSCGYKTDVMTSFFVCDDDWQKGQEITAVDMQEESRKTPTLLMERTHLADVLPEEKAMAKAKLLFEFDMMCERYLYMQLKEVKQHAHLMQPALALTKGKAPKQEGDLDALYNDLDTSDMYGEEGFNEDEMDSEGFQDLEDIEQGGY